MRIMGMNAAAILVAAVATYAVGFVIYGLMVPPDTWMQWAGIEKAALDAQGMARLPYSWIMPVMTAIGMAVLFSWANVQGAATGARWGALIALLSAIPALWYGWVYGVDPVQGTWLDSAHLLIGHVVAGAILGGWR